MDAKIYISLNYISCLHSCLPKHPIFGVVDRIVEVRARVRVSAGVAQPHVVVLIVEEVA
jgi:hypothetical protein